MRLRIVHVIETSGPGGGESVFLDLVSASRAAGHHVVAVVPAEGWVTSSLRARGVTPVLLPSADRRHRAFDLRQLRALRQILQVHRADLVHSHMLGMSAYASLAALSTGTPMLCTLHGQVDLGEHDRMGRLKQRIVGLGASRIVVVSESLQRDALRRTSWSAAQLSVIHNGADADSLATEPPADLRQTFGIRADDFLIGALGNIRPAKAYDDLLRAVAIARQQSPQLRAVIVGQGEGALLDSLLALRAALGLDDIVHFAGFRPNAGGVLRAFDAFVLASRSEGFSIATLQAMALGLPVTATRSGGPEEIVTDGVDGLLVPVADASALADALLRLQRDPSLRARLGAAARQTAQERFSLALMRRRYLELYAAIAAPQPAFAP